jgi:hypothetical protein
MKITTTPKEIIYGKFQSTISAVDSVVSEAKGDLPSGQTYSANAVFKRASKIKEALISDLSSLISSVTIDNPHDTNQVKEKEENKKEEMPKVSPIYENVSTLEKLIISGDSSQYTQYVMSTNLEEFKSDLLEILSRQRQKSAALINNPEYLNTILNSKLIDE